MIFCGCGLGYNFRIGHGYHIISHGVPAAIAVWPVQPIKHWMRVRSQLIVWSVLKKGLPPLEENMLWWESQHLVALYRFHLPAP
jgi:hypothetical protein